MAAHNNLVWNRGEDVLLTFTEQPVPTNITGWTITFRIKVQLADVSSLLTIAGTVTDGPNGVYTVAISASQNTSVLTAGQYFHSVIRTDSGSVAVLSEGPVTVNSTAYLL
jgi:hypothetical protein